MKRYGRTNRRAPFARRKPRVKRAPRKRSTLVKTIKRVIHSQIENKEYTTYAANQSIFNAQTTAPSYTLLVPILNQGVQQDSRIGNKINVVSAKIRGYVNIKPYNLVSNPAPNDIYVKMWVCRRKATNLVVSPTPSLADWNNFFVGASAASLPFQGTMLDMLLYPNSEYWTILQTKQVRLGNGNMLTYPAQSNALANSSGGTTSAYFSFDFTKHLGMLTFNDNIAGYPSNKELFLVYQAVDAQGNTLGSTTTPAEFHQVLDIKYEDA